MGEGESRRREGTGEREARGSVRRKGKTHYWGGCMYMYFVRIYLRLQF